MICPVCSHKAISFPRFLFMFYPQYLTCRHCGAKLTWSAKWKQVFHWSIVICGVSAVVLSVFRHDAAISLSIYIAAVLVVVLIFDGLFWRISIYEKTP